MLRALHISNHNFVKRYSLWLIFNLLLTLKLVSVANAADQPLVITITSGRIETPLEETAAAASVIDQDQIQTARQQLGIDEILTGVPGVFALNRYNFAQDVRLSVRGFGARSNFGIRGLRISIDGAPATTPDGQSSIDDVDLGSLARIELLRGPAGALYGPTSGGVLRLESERGSAPPYLTGQLKAGAYNAYEKQIKFGGDNGKWEHFFNASRQSISGYRRQSASERDVLNTRVDASLQNGGDLTVTLAALNAPLAQDPGGLTEAEVNADPRQAAPFNLRFKTGESVRQQRVGVSSRHPLTNRSELRLRGYGVAREFSSRLPFTIVELDRIFGGGGIEYRRADFHRGLSGETLLGFDLGYQDDSRRRRENLDGVSGNLTFDQDERVLNQGVFILRQQPISEALRLDLGLRYDWLRISAHDHRLDDGDNSDSLTFKQWSPSLALLWRSNPKTPLYVRISTGFETPTTTELARPDGAGGFNNGLKPETSINYELGGRTWLGAGLYAEAALFRIDISDQLVPFEIANSLGRFAYENAGSSRNVGLEAALTTGEHFGWGGRLAYTYMDFRYLEFNDVNNEELTDKRLPGVPNHLLNAELRYRHHIGLFAALHVQHVGSFYADNANHVVIDRYVVSNLRFSHEKNIGELKLGMLVGINNLFDKNYFSNVRLNASASRYFEPAPPRHVYVGMNATWYFR